jgi:predicted TIM-barrel fold metal-dependent hydrolase
MVEQRAHGDDRAVIVSTDGHISPLLSEMREYCAPAHLEAYDEFAGMRDAILDMTLTLVREIPGGAYPEILGTLDAPYHSHIEPRIPEMDRDGIAAEILFQGSTNFEPLPFGATFGGSRQDGADLAAEGQHIYNAWLADAVSVAPERFLALAQVPMWDIPAAVREVEWAAEAGFAGVNFPAPRPELLHYDDPAWEPFWSACAANEMLLASHSGGAADPADLNEFWYFQFEGGGAANRRALYRMIFGGVFHRHPTLKVMFTEQPGDWWRETMSEYDSVYLQYPQLRDPDKPYYCPNQPSEYCASNVLVGASFLAPFEAHRAIDEGYARNVCWGRDFPHPEGTWKPHGADDEPTTHLQLRYVFSEVEPHIVRDMVGGNVIRECNLDGDLLAKVAEGIDAPTYAELGIPIEAIPENAGIFSFRTVGAWG